MKRIELIILAAAFLCAASAIAWGEEKEVRFHVKGLDCARSEIAFTDLLKALEGVGRISTDVAEATATVVYDDEKTGIDKMTEQIEKGEFKVKSSETLR